MKECFQEGVNDHAPARPGMGAGWLIPPMAVGLFLRIWNLSPQILLDDEFHGLRAALYSPCAHILKHFGNVDHCIPLSLLYKLCASTIGLDEMVMRMPVLLFGVMACVAIPLLLRRAHPGAAVWAAWMIAISPPLVFFSRYCRPYSITTTLMMLAILSAWMLARPASQHSRRAWLLFILSLIFAPWFHLSVLAPAGTLMLTLFLLLLRQGARERRSRARCAAPFVMIAAGWAVLLLPPLVTGFSELEAIATRHPVPLNAPRVLQAWYILCGVSSPPFAGALGLLSLGGIILLWRRDRTLALLLLAPALTQWLATAALHPSMAGVPAVCARYCILTVMVFAVAIAFVASAAASLQSRVLRLIATSTTGLWILALFLSSSLPLQMRLPDNWTNCRSDQDRSPFQRPKAADWLEPVVISPFYLSLARQPAGSLALVEVPWNYEWVKNPYPYYQHIHHQPMKVGFIRRYPGTAVNTEIPLDDPRLRFRNFVDMKNEAAIRSSAADLVVVHKNHGREVPCLRDLPNDDLRINACIQDLSHRFGAPVFEDDYLVVYAVSGSTP